MKILGIGNAIVDVLCKVTDEFLIKNSLTKSTMKLVDEIEFLPFPPSARYAKFSPKNESVKILERSLSRGKLRLDIGRGGLPPFEPPPEKRGGGGGGGSDELVYKVFFTRLMGGFGIVFVVPVNIS